MLESALRSDKSARLVIDRAQRRSFRESIDQLRPDLMVYASETVAIDCPIGTVARYALYNYEHLHEIHTVLATQRPIVYIKMGGVSLEEDGRRRNFRVLEYTFAPIPAQTKRVQAMRPLFFVANRSLSPEVIEDEIIPGLARRDWRFKTKSGDDWGNSTESDPDDLDPGTSFAMLMDGS